MGRYKTEVSKVNMRVMEFNIEVIGVTRVMVFIRFYYVIMPSVYIKSLSIVL